MPKPEPRLRHATYDHRSPLDGLHGILLSFPVALFTTALASDVAYLQTAEIQWSNFSSWAIAGALVFGGLVAAWALVDWLVKLDRPDSGRRFSYVAVLAVMWIIGLVNAFHHARDAWSSVGATGVGLSVVTVLLAMLAGWMFFSQFTRPDPAR